MAMLGLALNKSYGIWFLSLAVMILFLPLFEAPKTISLILFYLIGFFSIWKRKGTFSFDKDDIFICFWMVSGYVVALFAGLHHKEWGGAFGVLELALLLFLVKHNNLDNKMRYLLCGVVFI